MGIEILKNYTQMRWKILKKKTPQQDRYCMIVTPRPLFDGIMFLTACDDDFILKCEWIHISGGSMCLPVENESTPWHTTYTTCAAHVYTEINYLNS